ncbi:MAG: response regulator [Deltaproteobacteria bacterium]|nr:response regulator [Deltaproteobacteria bacterium]
MFNYLRGLLRHSESATLNLDDLPDGFRDLGQGLLYFGQCITEAKAFADALSRGDLNFTAPPSANPITGPLKALLASLRHLAWQTREIAQGDYAQRVDFMGDFSDSFNSMVVQLEQRSVDLLQAKNLAEAASESKSVFLSTVSHEMRTPLNAILGLATIELQENLPPHTRVNLEKIYTSGSLLLSLVNDILDLSKIEAGGFEIIPTDYDVADLINDLTQINLVRNESKNLIFELDMDETIPQKMRGDVLRVKQILNNILSNAFKYTEKGKIKFDISWKRKDDSAILFFTVSDTGIGIKKDDMGKLFTEYSQINSYANRNIEGTGLGLSIAKHLADLMNGIITVKSEYGIGSTFRFDLQQQIVDFAPIGAENVKNLKNFHFLARQSVQSKEFVRAYMPYGKILLVDDVPTNLDVAKGLMLPYGLHVDCASCGQEAIAKIRSISDDSATEQQYDIVFMDHMMPGMDGVEATRIIRNEIGTSYARTVPIIALTANALAGNEKMFLANGFTAFIPKPIDLTQLDAALNKYVRDKQSDESLARAERDRRRGIPSRHNETAAGSVWEGFAVNGLDIASGVRRYGSDAAYRQILHSYLIHTPELLQRLRRTAEDFPREYAVEVHGLKGSSYGICAGAVGDMAAELERAAKLGDTETLRTNHETLMTMTETLLADLKNMLRAAESTVPAQSAKERLPAPNRALLEKMLYLAERCKTSLMEEVITEMERYEYDSQAEIVPWLRERINNFEYQMIRDRLREKIA